MIFPEVKLLEINLKAITLWTNVTQCCHLQFITCTNSFKYAKLTVSQVTTNTDKVKPIQGRRKKKGGRGDCYLFSARSQGAGSCRTRPVVVREIKPT